MKYKILAMFVVTFVLSMPVIGFWHPPSPPAVIPPCTYMGTLLNGNATWIFDGPSEDFDLTVYVAQVEDMYGYEFIVAWDSKFFKLVGWTVATDIWDSQAIVFNGTIGAGAYQQIVTAMPPSTGATGDFQLVNLKFHVTGYPCPDMPATGTFDLTNTKIGNSCSGVISLCNPLLATWTLPLTDIYIEPVAEVNSKVSDRFTASVQIKHAAGMRNFGVRIEWNDYLHGADECNLAGQLTTLLITDKNSVVLNTDLFNESTAFISVYSPPCGVQSLDGYVYVSATVINSPLDLAYPAETIWLFNVTFTKCDPWYSGAQPRYNINTETHEYLVKNASAIIWFSLARIGTTCFISPKVTAGNYTFAPIPGDLDGSGSVDVVDLMIEAAYYALPVSCNAADMPAGGPPNGFTYFYDLNHDGVIDVYDVVIVGKNVGRSVP